MLLELNLRPSLRQLRQFAGLVVPLVGLLVVALLVGQFDRPVLATVLGVATLGLSVCGLVWPHMIWPVYAAWMVAAYPVGWVLGHVVMAVVFYLLVTPIGLLMRLFGRDPLARRFDPGAASYWKTRRQVDDRSRYFRQF